MVTTTAAGTGAGDLTRLVPGFDFLQGLMKAGSAGLPGIGQWIAPTLDPAELQKRIEELRTVQFWLEQNARLLGTTIQALEVQRMTVATLRGMNLPVADLADVLKAGSKPAGAARADRAGDAPKAATPAAAGQRAAAKGAAAGGNGRGGAAAAVDPMQWWGALTQQFTELAAKAMKEGSAEMARMSAASTAPARAGAAAPTSLAAAAATSIERAMAASTQLAGAAAKAGAALSGAAAPPSKAPAAPRAAAAARRRSRKPA